MGVSKNDVGRPSNKTIIIRRILKVVLLLIIIALAFLIGYNLKDKNSNNPIKSSGKKIQSDDSIKTSKEELQLDDSIVKKLYSEIENVSFYEKIDGNIEDLCAFYCEDMTYNDMDDNFKMSLVLNQFDLEKTNKIKYEEIKEKYYDIFGNYDIASEFYNYNINKLGNVKLNKGYYQLLGEDVTVDPILGTGYTLVSAQKDSSKIELFIAQWYNNADELIETDEPIYEYYDTNACGDVKCSAVFKSSDVNDSKNVIKNNKLTHAYLFVGPRGTGKTSIAKIFAKTINCLHPEDGLSCEKCDICISNNSNENVDVIEMDAASNNGVDEIREIRNHITLLPTVSKYKIYIIDEVHMLTTGAFNALLKTLEEPPEHIIFILATTEPHKIPLTIMSRCQSFEFKPIPVATIKERLKYICAQENINIDDKSLNLIAEESNGGLRDAVSMLDQLNAYADGNIKYEDVLILNGRINDDEIEKFMTEMVNDDLNSVFTKIESWQEEGKNFIYICEDFIRFLRNELIKFKLENNSNIVNLIGENKTIEVIMILNKISNDMKISKDKKVLFDVTIINITNILKSKQMFENNTYTSKNINIENKTPEKVEIKEEKPQTVEVPIKETKDYTLYDELMSIRLNNTLGIADKKSKIEYENAVENLKNDISDLNKLKIINLLDDTKITAGSKDGIILTTDSDNILHDLYDNMELLEESLESLLGKKVKVCILLDELWNKKRIIYVEKIKNKEKIDIIDEEDILNKIKSLNTGEKSEFDDLLEIGGE